MTAPNRMSAGRSAQSSGTSNVRAYQAVMIWYGRST
jgi:hypothetical protein